MPWVDVACEKCGRVRRRYARPSHSAPRRCSSSCRWPVRRFTCRACGDRFERRIGRRKKVFLFCSRRCAGLAPVGTQNKRWEFTPQMDALIRDVFATEGRGRKLPGLRAAHAAFRAIPPYMIWHRSRLIGAAPVVDKRPWADAEDALLDDLAGEFCVEQIRRRFAAAGFRRSVGAIANRIWRGKVRGGVRGATITAQEVGRILGWHSTTVLGWLRDGRLPSVKHGHVHRVHPRQLARFVREHAAMLGAHRVDLEAVVRLLDDYPWGGEAQAAS